MPLMSYHDGKAGSKYIIFLGGRLAHVMLRAPVQTLHIKHVLADRLNMRFLREKANLSSVNYSFKI